MSEQIEAGGEVAPAGPAVAGPVAAGPVAAGPMASGKKTPWQKCFAKLGLRQSDLAKQLGCTRSNIARNLYSPRGLISGNMQEKLIDLGKRIGRPLDPADLLPDL